MCKRIKLIYKNSQKSSVCVGMKAQNIKRLIPLLLLALLMISVFPVYAANEDLKVTVHAKKGENNSIVISGKIILKGIECEDDAVKVTITIHTPLEETSRNKMVPVGDVNEHGSTTLIYEETICNVVSEKGMYTVSVTASIDGYSATAVFKFDPPCGGTPGCPL